MFNMDFWKDKKTRKITASLFLLAVFLLLSLLGTGNGIEYDLHANASESEVADTKEALKSSGTDMESTGSSEIIFVDVIGCVKHPGVYQLEANSRVFQLIELAGGLTEDAEVRSINRAAVLHDEQVVTVLSVEEYEELQSKSAGVGFVDGKVELNTADAKALESLSGIGPAMAQKIIDYRDAHGGFSKAEELMKVDGIGEKTFQRLKDKICVQ